MQVSCRTLSVVLAAVFMAPALLVGRAAPSSRAADDASKPTASKEPARQTPARVLHFPKDQSLGVIKIQDENVKRQIVSFQHHIDGANWGENAETVGAAIGDVAIPAGKRVQLLVGRKAWQDLAPLARLKPDDLYGVEFSGSFSEADLADDRCMTHLKRLTGLKELNLSFTKITGKGLRNITGMKTLECLHMPEGGAKDPDLAPLLELRQLRRLYLYQSQITTAGVARLAKTMTALEELCLDGKRLDDNALVHVAQLPSLRYLVLGQPNLTDAGLAHLKKAPALRILRLTTSQFTDKGMEHLSRLSQLENLALHWMDKITDQGIASLAKMPSLRKLDVSSAQLTDEGLAPLTRVKTLEHVDLPSMGRTDQALMYMAQCRGLKHLWAGSASNGSYSDAGLRHLIKLQELEFLSIGGTGITDDGIVCLADLKNLKELFVFSPNLTDKSLAHLAKMESLRELTIRNSMGGDQYDVAFTIAGVSQLNTLSNLTRLKTEVVSQDNSTLRIGDMKSLESLDITPKKKRMGKKVVAERSLRDEDLACLAQLTRLKRFRDGACYLDYAYGISDAGAAHLAGLANMEDLAIGGPDLTDQALASLANMPRLNYLHIKGGHFTEKGLRHLESLQLLHTLHIKSDQSFSKEAVQRLKQALPNLGTFQLN